MEKKGYRTKTDNTQSIDESYIFPCPLPEVPNMHFVQILMASLAAVAGGMAAHTPSCPPFASSMIEFSADFKQPEPPLLKSEYQTNFIQHKWYGTRHQASVRANEHHRNENLTHITTGFITNSPSKGFVRADEAFDGNLASSFFNYANVTEEGLVDNTLTTYSSNSTTPDVWRGYVNSNFPIFEESILVTAGAVFGGLVQRQFVEGRVAAVRNPRCTPSVDAR